MNSILWFQHIGMADLPQVGGKNASLGELIAQLIPIYHQPHCPTHTRIGKFLTVSIEYGIGAIRCLAFYNLTIIPYRTNLIHRETACRHYGTTFKS